MVKDKMLTAHEFLVTRMGHGSNDMEYQMIEFAKLHVKAALLAAKNELLNSNIEIDDKAFDKMGEVILDLKCQNTICKNILKIYPDKNIK